MTLTVINPGTETRSEEWEEILQRLQPGEDSFDLAGQGYKLEVIGSAGSGTSYTPSNLLRIHSALEMMPPNQPRARWIFHHRARLSRHLLSEELVHSLIQGNDGTLLYEGEEGTGSTFSPDPTWPLPRPAIRFFVLDPSATGESGSASNTGESILKALRARLSDFQHLTDNWDGYEGLPATGEAAATADRILSETNQLAFELGIEPSLGPLANGGLDLEWDSRKGNELLIEIQPHGGNLNYVLSKRTSDGSYEDRSGRLISTDDVSDLIKELV